MHILKRRTKPHITAVSNMAGDLPWRFAMHVGTQAPTKAVSCHDLGHFVLFCSKCHDGFWYYWSPVSLYFQEKEENKPLGLHVSPDSVTLGEHPAFSYLKLCKMRCFFLLFFFLMLVLFQCLIIKEKNNSYYCCH